MADVKQKVKTGAWATIAAAIAALAVAVCNGDQIDAIAGWVGTIEWISGGVALAAAGALAVLRTRK